MVLDSLLLLFHYPFLLTVIYASGHSPHITPKHNKSVDGKYKDVPIVPCIRVVEGEEGSMEESHPNDTFYLEQCSCNIFRY